MDSPRMLPRMLPFRVARVVLVGCVIAGCARQHDDTSSAAPGQRAGSASPRDSAAGSGGSRSAPAKLGASASVKLESLRPMAEDGAIHLRGTGTFRVSDLGVDLTLAVHGEGCMGGGESYSVFILEGGDCSDATVLGEHWDGTRGEGLPSISCAVGGRGRIVHSRSAKGEDGWTIDGPDRTDLMGHAVALYDDAGPAACGVITRDEAMMPPATKPAPVSVEQRAAVAGLCQSQLFVRDSTHACPNPKELDACATAHCDVDDCVQKCSGWLECLKRSADMCSVAYTCEVDAECSECQGSVTSCTWNFCLEEVACAAPVTPDGPCSQLLACCAMQGERAAMCTDIAQAVAKVSGDPSCYGLQHDWDFVSHLPVPCQFEQ